MGLMDRFRKKKGPKASRGESDGLELAVGTGSLAESATRDLGPSPDEMRKQKLKEVQLQREKEKQEKQREKQELAQEKISGKRKNIEQVKKAIRRFETELLKEMKAGREAQRVGKKREAIRHAESAKRLKARITTYENQLKVHEDQLYALEDAGTNLTIVDDIKDGSEAINKLNEGTTAEDVADILGEAREAIDQTQSVQDAFQAEANMHGADADEDDLLAELHDDSFGIEEFEDPTEEQIAQKIPELPTNLPMPQGAAASKGRKASSAPTQEDDEIKALEMGL